MDKDTYILAYLCANNASEKYLLHPNDVIPDNLRIKLLTTAYTYKERWCKASTCIKGGEILDKIFDAIIDSNLLIMIEPSINKMQKLKAIICNINITKNTKIGIYSTHNFIIDDPRVYKLTIDENYIKCKISQINHDYSKISQRLHRIYMCDYININIMKLCAKIEKDSDPNENIIIKYRSM